MTRGRRLPAAVATALLAVALTAPPAVAADPMVEWTRPTLRDRVLDEPGPITGTVTGEEGQKIQTVEFSLTPETPATPDDPCFVDVPSETSVLDGNRTENFELDLDFPCNRAYTVEVTVGYEEPALGVDVVEVPARSTTTSSLPFRVAIPPAQVEGVEAGYDEGTKEVRLRWTGNGEADLLGYVIERNPPGPEGFAPLGPALLGPGETTFIDTGIDDEHRYRVTAVRRGPEPDSQIRGEPSSLVTAGPERTEPTLPDDLPEPNSAPPAGRRSGGGGGGRGGGGGGGSSQRPATPPAQTRPTSNIFEETLPFDPSQTTDVPPPTTEGPPGDAAVLAEFDDDTDDDRRATLVPLAGGLALVVGAMHLFLISKRAGEPDIPMSAGRPPS